MKTQYARDNFTTNSLSCKNFQPKYFTTHRLLAYFSRAFAKSRASRRKLNSQKANSTPILDRAFFVRSFRTPKECQEFQENRERLSMVGVKGNPLRLTVFLLRQVPTPLRLPPAVGSTAVSLRNIQKDTAKMIYKFLILGKKRLTIRILANSEQEARQRLGLTSPALCIARLGGIYA